MVRILAQSVGDPLTDEPVHIDPPDDVPAPEGEPVRITKPDRDPVREPVAP